MKQYNNFQAIQTEVWTEYRKLYETILNRIYPAKKSTGFPERNLSVNFSKSYESVVHKYNQIAYTWFEFQFGEKNNKHLDALIINDTTHEIFIIEAKRYNNPQQKKSEICKDIDRIPEFVKDLDGRLNADGTNRFGYNFYCIILADVWDETDEKKTIIEFYRKQYKEKPLKEFLSIDEVPLLYPPNKISCNIQSFEQMKGAVRNYNLVSMWWNLKSSQGQ